MMQLLGTEFIRNMCSPLLNNFIEFNNKRKEFSYHIKKLYLDYYDLFNKEGSKIVIADVRFPDEVEFIKWIGGTIIKVNRDTEENEYSNHESEKNIDKIKDVDIQLDNDRTIQHLYKKISILILED